MLKKDDFMAIASVLIEDHFPKGVATERGEAMVLVAELMRYLTDKGLIEGA